MFGIKHLCLTALIISSLCSLQGEKDYTNVVKFLDETIRTDSRFRHSAYQRLAYIVDTYGPRLWGSSALQQVIAQMKAYAEQQNFGSVRLQPVSNFTKWIRGEQSLILKSPRPTPTVLDVIGLGGTVPGNIEAEVIVVRNYDELQRMKAKVIGKIVCYNNEWVDYPTSGQYRVNGASIAAKYGAVAMLVRSVTPSSISSVHTGYQQYDPKYKKIPSAAITVEDAQMFQRMQDRGQTITVHLNLQSYFVEGANSSNLIVEIKGTEKPDQIVLAGGHIDSWDTGSQTGANDDGGGFITVFEAFRMINKLGLRPRRTMRFIAWSGQQSGSPIDGAAQYLERHRNQLSKHVVAFESDAGSTQLYGFGHNGEGVQIVKQIVSKYMSLLNAGQYSDDGYNVDVEPLYKQGVPIISNLVRDTPNFDNYYRYHHTAGDTMDIMDADEMDGNVVGIASILFIIADLQVSLRG